MREPKVMISFQIPLDLADKLHEAAMKNRLSKTSILISGLEKELQIFGNDPSQAANSSNVIEASNF